MTLTHIEWPVDCFFRHHGGPIEGLLKSFRHHRSDVEGCNRGTSIGAPIMLRDLSSKKKIPPKKSFVWRNQSNLVSRSNRTFIFMKSYCRNTFVFDFSLSFFFLLPLNSQGIYSSEVWGPQRVWAYWYNPPHRGQFDVSG